MGKITKKAHSESGNIYTLAQSETTVSDNSTYFNERLVYGMGTDGKNSQALKGRAKCKLITQKTILQLIKVAEEKGATERIKSYWNTYHCQGQITSSNDRIYGKYCKTRFCTLCLRIRKAEIINKYLPTIEQWESPYFVTLTVKAVKEDKLKSWINGFGTVFRKITGKYKKRHQRGKGKKLMGIKSLECNFNPKEQTYNPHLHLIVPDKETADIFLVEWQRYMKGKNTNQKYTSAWAQHKRPIKQERVKDLIETIKYGSKIFTEPDVKNKSKSKNKIPPAIYANALDNIFAAMKGKRLFDRFGFDLPKQTKTTKSTAQFIKNFDDWIYDNSINDWINHSTGELLTGYVPPAQLSYLLNSINTDLE